MTIRLISYYQIMLISLSLINYYLIVMITITKNVSPHNVYTVNMHTQVHLSYIKSRQLPIQYILPINFIALNTKIFKS